jgi:hypothetical protein
MAEPEAAPVVPVPAEPAADAPATSDSVGVDLELANGVRLDSADLGRRFGALLIDWILCTVISFLHRSWWTPSVVLIVEYAFFIGLVTQTPGMYFTSVRCVSIRDGGPIGILSAAVRGFLLAILIPALFVFADPLRRGWHDKVTNSMVVSGRRNTAA